MTAVRLRIPVNQAGVVAATIGLNDSTRIHRELKVFLSLHGVQSPAD